MILHPPFGISSRLLPGLQVAGAWLSIGLSGETTRDGRDVYECWIDLPDGSEHHITDMRSGCQGGSVAEGFKALLSFLMAAEESRRYRVGQGRAYVEDSDTNEALFPAAVVEWVSENSDALEMASCEVEEADTLIVED